MCGKRKRETLAVYTEVNLDHLKITRLRKFYFSSHPRKALVGCALDRRVGFIHPKPCDLRNLTKHLRLLLATSICIVVVGLILVIPHLNLLPT